MPWVDHNLIKTITVLTFLYREWVASLGDGEGIAGWNEGDHSPRILLDCLKSDSAYIGRIGSSVAELFPAKNFVAFAKEWIETNLALESRMPS
jgi:hypothetical protein